MKLIACTFLYLIILEVCYCGYTSSANKSRSNWGYSYGVTDHSGYEVTHGDDGYQVAAVANTTSTGKQHYNSWSVYDHITSPEVTNDTQPHRSTNDKPSIPSNRPFHQNTDVPPYTQRTPSSGITTGPLYYPYRPSYTPVYGPPAGPVFGVPNGQLGPQYAPPIGPVSGYGPYTGQVYVPPTGPVVGYVPYNGQVYVLPTGPVNGYRPYNGQM